ncbi:RING/U-box [Glarea lozoyensis ATCC 20868]|uniref:RING/U-box n=1 Tax=Glarea lozoyensis (strain ATCC 20868 / MF5171) TaxID=1116229 RepID=S3D105_GLAL2|nr:RING/U-box [Glarea lozoyensis ATCC 20868]EPE30824.1 RING/U-box [Glarea lozoyensis ATCC 20868]
MSARRPGILTLEKHRKLTEDKLLLGVAVALPQSSSLLTSQVNYLLTYSTDDLLFPNTEWDGDSTDADLDAVVAQLSPNISFSQDVVDSVQTLSTQNADRSGVASGFLYVPDLDRTDPCYNISKTHLPNNVTRQANLAPTDFALVALAPWINAECTQSYLRSARSDPSKAFLFYLPDNSTEKPPSSSSPVWDLQDGGAWRKKNMYPVYAISGYLGGQLMVQLSHYSGNMTSVPYGHEISELPGTDPRDYVRMYTEIDTSNLSTLPSFWKMILVVVAVLVSILTLTSACMHLTQKRRRKSLQSRVESGDVNLEALGIKRLTIPQEILDLLPIFVYTDEISSQSGILPPTPSSPPGEISISEVLLTKQLEGARPGAIETRSYIPQETIIITDPADPNVALPHRFLPYTQPTCPICFDEYVSEVTEIKELPCGHIYHPECIDSFLGAKSSLCPLCKQCALPPGYCPVKVSNAMVRKERNIRKLRQTRVEDDDTWNDVGNLGSRVDSQANANPTLGHPMRSSVISSDPARPQSLRFSNVPAQTRQSRQDFVAERILELAARQAPIQDPDSQSRRVRAKWRTNVSRVFPGFR